MSAAVIASMLVLPASASAAPAADVLPIKYTYVADPAGSEQDGHPGEPVIISFEGQTNFEKNAVFKTFSGSEHGAYEFVKLADGTQCLKLCYNKNQWWDNYRAMFTFKDAGTVSSAYKYACITYMTEDTEPAFIRLTNVSDQDDAAVFTANASVSGGEWTVSAPTPVSNGKIIDGMAKGAAFNCAVEYSAEGENCALYIKEIIFFTSEASAYEYYGGDVKMGEAYLPDPVIMSFEGEKKFSENAIFKTFSGNQQGIYEFVTLADGTECLKLCYNKYSGWSSYRMMPTFKDEGIINENYKYVRITYMTDAVLPTPIRVTNNANKSDTVVLVSDASVSNGEWKTSNAAFIGGGDIAKRWSAGQTSHCTLEYSADSDSDMLYIRELAFFATEEQAYEYYGDSKQDEISTVYSVMLFGEKGNSSVNRDNPTFGQSTLNAETNAIDITYKPSHWYDVKYMAKLRFNEKNSVNSGENYVRLLYSAKNPAGVTGASLFVINDLNKTEIIELQKNVKDTNGEFVLSDTTYLPDSMIDRLSGKSSGAIHASFCSSANKSGGTYSIKAVYFFPSKEAADAFEYSTEDTDTVKVTIGGNDIENYRIVVPAEGNRYVTSAAETFAGKIKELCDVELPVVTDDNAATPYEILIGHCNRPESETLLEKATATGDGTRYEYGVINGKLVINATEQFAIRDGAEMFVETYIDSMNIGVRKIDFNARYNRGGSGKIITKYPGWAEIGNVDAPTVMTDDFSTDMKYFTEDGGADNAKIENGVLTLTAKDASTAYVHVYESNVRFDAKLKYTGADADGEMGLALRYTAADAYIRGGYSKATGEWYIQYREGTDFAAKRVAAKSYALAPDTWYDVALIANGMNVTLEVNGEKVLSADGIVHVTPGKVGIFADGMTVTADNVKIALLSGEGTVLRGVEHTILPGEQYREGGSVIEMTDGSLRYETHHSKAAFKSLDGGKTWTESDPYFKLTTYPQILRLNNGDILSIVESKADGTDVRLARLSSDDGKTWRNGGVVCPHKYSGIRSLNMNDKVFQSATTGRIFYSQSYQGPGTVDGIKLDTFCVFFYSDDNGMTWHESETGSWEIEGNQKETRFAESKIIECADGTLRIYNSFSNSYPCIVYSESTDNGVTWGPIQKIPELVCTCSSSAIVRDPYADNDTTYYMVWVYCNRSRSRLSLAKSTDGKTWSYIGDIWRWESRYRIGASGLHLSHIVDPFVSVSRDKILVGAGIAEFIPETGPITNGHGELRQHIFAIDRDTLGEGKPTNKFLDMDMGAPYYEAVTYVSSKGLFQGTADNAFSPDANMTRSMFVTVLGRLDGADMSAYAKPTFKDVPAGQWYTSYVEWAAANGIVNGLGDGNYGVNNHVTVQQACVILARYANYKNGTAYTDKNVNSFSDGAAVADWAVKEMNWAVSNGVYTGMNGLLNPNTPATRAVVAEMFYNYSKNIG